MFYIVTKIIWFFLQPVAFGLLLLAIGTILTATRWHRTGRRLLTLTLLAAAAICFLPVVSLVTVPLENRFAAPNPPPAHVDGIIVLGGGENRLISQTRGVASMPQHMQCLLTATALLRAHPEAQLYFSGGGAAAVVEPPTESDIARVLLVEMGADMNRVHFEDRSRNTWENFVYTKQLAAPRPDQTWLLVTSALHMPRSMGIARKLGWPMVAYPTDYTSARIDSFFSVLGISGIIDGFDNAMREWIGLVGYYALGKTSDLFPSP